MIQVAQRDPSVARVLRQICGLDGALRSTALDLVAAHLRAHAAAEDILECIAALRRDEVVRRIADALAPPGS